MAEGSDEGLLVCDAHMHCWDETEKVSKFNNHILSPCGTYLPEDYRNDMLGPGRKAVRLRAAVHVEAFPTDQVEETRWITSLKSDAFPVQAIVANANISLQKENERSHSTQQEGMAALEDVLKRHKAASSLVRGVRWVLNHEPNWPQVHRGDYFTDPQFRAGFQKLQQHNLSFDLQCNPHQLEAAAAFLKDFPDVPVCLNHIGCLKLEGEQASSLETWRQGMKALASLPQVYCKLSMLAYTLPNWWESEEGTKRVTAIVHEVIEIFGAGRCMFASNFPAEPPGVGRHQLYTNFLDMVKHLPQEDQSGLFYRNAERFYRISLD